MADFLDSNACDGFQGRTTETQDNRVALSQPFNSLSMAPQEDKDSSGIVSASGKEQGEFVCTTEDMQERVLAFAALETGKSFASLNEKIAVCELVCASSGCYGKDEDFSEEGLYIGGEDVGIEGKQETFDSVKVKLENAVCNDDGKEEMYFLKHDMSRSGIQESRVFNKNTSWKCGASVEKPMVDVELANEDMVSENVLEVKKKRLLQELEAALLPKDDFVGQKINGGKMVQEDMPIRTSLGIEVVDETALIETIAAPGMGTNSGVLGSMKCTGKNAIKEIDVKNEKRSRKGAKAVKRLLKTDGRHKSMTELDDAQNDCSQENGNETKRKYLRKELEALRFLQVADQRKFWKAIYSGLDTAVAKEYDTLASSEHQKHIRLNNDPRQCFAKKKQTPILSAMHCENIDNKLQQMESSEIVSPVDLSCSHIITGENACTNLEGEYSEDGDSEDDYDGIQKPAFLVQGEPNFDSGPPEDGWEYLRRVRWEAAQIPKVKVAKLDRSKFSKEQSAYMPKIPDIAKCPEHLLPLKQWEDVFLAEFSQLRANISRLDGSSVVFSKNLHPIHSTQASRNDFGTLGAVMPKEVLLHNQLSLGKPIDRSSIFTAEDKDNILPLENPSSQTSIEQTSNSSPLVSAILQMGSVARVSMLQKRISLLEPADTITRNECMWLFAVCATVHAPLDADTCAALRSLLRKCASLRAGKAELDDEVVMLNILATISGRYFGQSEI